MKIGIITFQDAYNYGAVLQAYALKNKLGSNAKIVNYKNDYFKKTNHYYVNESNILKKIIRKTNLKKIELRTKKFHEFVNKYLVEDNVPVSKEDIQDKYDAFIVGSDQVWNLDCTGGDSTYYLDFTDTKKRYSYAASFGKLNPSQKEIELIKSQISQYRYISVREESARQILLKLGIKNVEVDLDPTFLISRNQWLELMKPIQNKEKYLFVYNVSGDIEILQYARKIAKEKKLKIYYITASIKPVFNVKKIMDAGPIDWLNYIMEAEMVLTNSYHGCIFSLIFHKNFRVFLSKNNLKNSTRIKELLNAVRLENIICGEELKNINIDYKKVDDILEQLKYKSNQYIKLICDESD